MVLKLLVVMVAVSALEGVFGHPDKQLVNGTQSKANVGHGKAQRGRRLDKLACQIFHGNCQRLEDTCDGVLEEGPNWCLHSRHFGCCIYQPVFMGCSLNGRVYRDGTMAEEWCVILICRNGEWFVLEVNPICGVTCILPVNGTTIMPFVPHPPLGNDYSITGYTGVFSFTQYLLEPNPLCGVDIYIPVDGIECIAIFCPGLYVEICCGSDDSYPSVWVNEVGPLPPWMPRTLFYGSNVIVFEDHSIYVICPEFSVCVNWVPGSDPWLFSVYIFSSPFWHGGLYGLSGVWVPPPYPEYGIMSNGKETKDLHAFIESWRLPHTRSHVRHNRKNPSSDKTGQVTVRPKIERSMSDIEKLCEEINKVPCTILSPEKCEKIMDDCVSRMSNVSKPGHGDFSDSSE